MGEKRRASEDGDAPPLKREATSLDEDITEEGPLTQADVVYFKKQAIWRQMAAYRSKLRLLEREVASALEEVEKHRAKVCKLDAWYSQLVAVVGTNDDDKNLLIEIDDVALEKRRVQLEGALKGPVSGSEESVMSRLGAQTAEAKRLAASNLELAKKVTELEVLVAKFEKSQLRDDSTSLNRVFGSVKEEEAEKPVETTEVEVDEASKEEVEKLQISLSEIQAESSLLKEQLVKSEAETTAALEKLVQLEHKVQEPSEEQIRATGVYKATEEENQKLKNSISLLEKTHEATTAKLQSFATTSDDSKYQVIADEVNQLKQQLHKTESDVVRIRTARDDLIAKNTILKAEIAQQQSHADMAALIKTLSKRLDDKPPASELLESLTGLSTDELVSKVMLLQAELLEVELAFNDTRKMALNKVEIAAAHDAAIKKLTVEKNKADQKYFGLMRLKDTISQENKLLKAQVSKLQEVVKLLQEVEKILQGKLELATRQTHEFQQIKETAIGETSRLSEQLARLKKLQESLVEETKRLRLEVEALVAKRTKCQQEVNEAQKAHSKMEAKLKATEALLKKYKSKNPLLVVEDEQEIEGLRSMAKCLVCLKNWKDTAITVCGHVFCNHCTSERLAARLRRCPSCNKGFSANDLLLIHL